jgi:alkanesulfonate monooxygenase SsuD/methylene tetrahydromethanopterin reductase-like flavin-dependent oxidoreductase (luciferase family)
VQHALYFAPFAELSDPEALLAVAVAAEEAGWDGLFLWDHVLRDPAEARDIADAWTMLAAVALRTERLRLGPMVTPASRRRVSTLVRQGTTVDHLSGGRLTVGLGLGVDTGGELSRFDEVVDPVTRGEILDEAADVLAQAWCGEHVEHHGRHLTVDGVTFTPRPVQRPSIPLWFAARDSALRPVRRAARHDGLFIIDVDLPLLQRALAEVVDRRGSLDGFDVAVRVSPIDDPALLEEPGVTWAMHSFPAVVPADELLPFAAAGPPG